MTTTVAKTYRLPLGLQNLIATEAERLKTSDADLVRLALRQYFDDRRQQDHIDASEHRLIARIDQHGLRLSQLIGQILTLAQPQ